MRYVSLLLLLLPMVLAQSLVISVPTLVPALQVDVVGTTAPGAFVQVFVQGQLERGTTTQNGSFHFVAVPLTEGNNTLLVTASSNGSITNTSAFIQADNSDPVLTVASPPSIANEANLLVNGTVNELSTIQIATSTRTGDGKNPLPVPLTVVGISENSVELNWTVANSTDQVEYVVHRGTVAIAVTAQTQFVDHTVGSSQSYSYFVVARDTECLESAPSNTVTITTHAGGTGANGTLEGSGECQPAVVQRTFAAEGNWSSPVALRRGVNIVKVNATNVVGLSDETSFQVTLNNQPPTILEHNLAELSPTYSHTVEVEGKIDVEVNEEVVVQVFVNDDLDATTTVDENGIFKVDIELERVVRTEGTNLQPEYDPARVSSALVQVEEGWKNRVRIVAVDEGGLQDEVEEEVIFAQCGFGAWWAVTLSDPQPSMLTPRLIVEGYGTVLFNYELEWNGLGNASITSVRADFKPLSTEERDEWDVDMVSGRPKVFSTADKRRGIVQVDLRKKQVANNRTILDVEKELANNREGECLLPGFGCIRVPIILEIEFSTSDYLNQTFVQRFERFNEYAQRQCIDMEVTVDKRLPSDKLPSSFLKATISVVNGTLEVIDALLEPLRTLQEVLFYSCGASWVVDFFLAASERFSCEGSAIAGIFAQSTFDPDIARTGQCEAVYEPNSPQLQQCMGCQDAVVARMDFENVMQWICDRIFCPAAPSFQTYVERVQGKALPESKVTSFTQPDRRTGVQSTVQGVLTDTTSDCSWPEVGVTYGNRVYEGVQKKGIKELFVHYEEYKENLQKVPPLPGQKGGYRDESGILAPEVNCEGLHVSDPRCCVAEYVNQWDSACMVFDEFGESACLAAQDAGAIDDFEDHTVGGDCNEVWNAVAGLCEKDKGPPFNLVSTVYYYPTIGCRDDRDCPSTRPHCTTQSECVQCRDDNDCLEYANSECRGNRCVSRAQRSPPSATGFQVFSNLATAQSRLQISNPYSRLSSNDKCGLKSHQFRPTDDTRIHYRVLRDDDGELHVHRGYIVETKYIERVAGAESLRYAQQGNDAYGEVDSPVRADLVFRPASVDLADYFRFLTPEERNALQQQQQGRVGTDYNDPQFLSFHEEITQCVGERADLRETRQIYDRIRDYAGVSNKPNIVDPASGFLRSAQCVCVPGITSYLSLYRNILRSVRTCVESVLVTGDGSPGVCRAVLSQYVCDLAFDFLSCFTEKYGSTSSRFDGGIGSIFGALTKAAGDVQNKVMSRYGDSAVFQNIFADRKLVNSMCLFAFTGTWDLDIAGALEQDISIPIQSQALLYPCERRYLTFNSVSNPSGLITYNYHVGVGLAAGSDVQVRAKLVCSDTYDCEGGPCDCVQVGRKEIPLNVNRGGFLRRGDILNEEVFQTVPDQGWRFDRVELEWQSREGTQNGVANCRVDDRGSAPPVYCGFDLGEGLYRCAFGFGEEDYIRFSTDPVPTRSEPYKPGEVIRTSFQAAQRQPADAEKVCLGSQFCPYSKYLVMTLKNQYGEIVHATDAVPFNGEKLHVVNNLPGVQVLEEWFRPVVTPLVLNAEVTAGQNRVSIRDKRLLSGGVELDVNLVYQGNNRWEISGNVEGSTITSEVIVEAGTNVIRYQNKFEVQYRVTNPVQEQDTINVRIRERIGTQNPQLYCPDTPVDWKLESKFFTADSGGYPSTQVAQYQGQAQERVTTIKALCQAPGTTGAAGGCPVDGSQLTVPCDCTGDSVADCGRNSGELCLDRRCWSQANRVYNSNPVAWCSEGTGIALITQPCMCRGDLSMSENVCTAGYCWDATQDGVRECNGVPRLANLEITDFSVEGFNEDIGVYRTGFVASITTDVPMQLGGSAYEVRIFLLDGSNRVDVTGQGSFSSDGKTYTGNLVVSQQGITSGVYTLEAEVRYGEYAVTERLIGVEVSREPCGQTNQYGCFSQSCETYTTLMPVTSGATSCPAARSNCCERV